MVKYLSDRTAEELASAGDGGDEREGASEEIEGEWMVGIEEFLRWAGDDGEVFWWYSEEEIDLVPIRMGSPHSLLTLKGCEK